MSRWFVWIGCGLVGIGLGPTLRDFLPVDPWAWLTDPTGRTQTGHFQAIRIEAGTGYVGDAFIRVGLVVLIAGACATAGNSIAQLIWRRHTD